MNSPGCFGIIAKKCFQAIVMAMLLIPLLSACDELAKWRDGQIKDSHAYANAGLLIAPDPPITVPTKIAKELPWDNGFVVMSFFDGNAEVMITALSSQDTLQTTNWMVARLAELGYRSGDNASRILDGVEYFKEGAQFPKLFVKVTMNNHEQCIVELKGSM